MACIQYPRKNRGGISLGSWEQPTIYKEPLKEVFTKKKERIEEGDVTYNIRNDPSRYNDAITNWQKGKNMMVEVDYQNRAPHTTTMNFGSASNPYKVNKAFRPPEYSLLDLEPLSRQQRPYVAAGTNIGSELSRKDQHKLMDQSEVDFSVGTPLHHNAITNVSKEMGVYHDNFSNKDMINEDYVTKHVTSQLKGLESNELQKLFQYENTPSGIIITPMMFSASTAVSGPKYDAERRMDQNAIQDILQYGHSSNTKGLYSVESQRSASDVSHLIQQRLQLQGHTNERGVASYENQRNAQEHQYVRDQVPHIGQGTNERGVASYEGQRYIHENINVRDLTQIGQGTNRVGQNAYDLQPIDEFGHIRDELKVGQGTNVVGASHQTSYEYAEQMKDVLLKNMTSSVHIVIQRTGDSDEYPIQGSIKDKINIIIDSAKGNSISLGRDNGEPVRLKEYTWKFVKSNSGSDKFIIQLPQEAVLELERKTNLHAMYSNPSNSVQQPDAEEVHLRREMRNMSASTNVGMSGDVSRIDESLFTNRVEKRTTYTDMMIQPNSYGFGRVSEPILAINPTESDKRQNIQQMMLHQSKGRFD